MKFTNLKTKLWIYLTIFAISLLLFLWFFQILFLNKFYELTKRKTIENISKELKKNYDNNDYLNNLAYEQEICIQIIQDKKLIYSSVNYNRGCFLGEEEATVYKNQFINSSFNTQIYEIMNPHFKNKTLLKGIKVDNDNYIFVSTSLMPLDSSITILKKQFIYVAIIVLLLAFIVGYFISKKLSHPLVKINESAKKFAKGNYDVVFDSNSDIEEIQELAKTLSYTRDELSKLEELRRDLLANVGHDLKTPLTMIKAYAEMVRDISYKNEEKRENHLNVIIDETDRLNLLVEDIIELSKMQSIDTDLFMENFDIHKIIQEVLKRYEILKETEEYEFIYTNTTEHLVFGNSKKIEQVLYNLINNAVNYTGNDKKIYILLEEEKERIKVSIKDTGKGIKEDDIPYIWDKYYHSNKKHKRNKVGTGIGLSIVKNVLEKHQVEYGVDSSKKGTTFYFYLDKK